MNFAPRTLITALILLSNAHATYAAEDRVSNSSSAEPTKTEDQRFERSIPRITLPGKFVAYDLTGENASALVKVDAPQATSTDRLSITVYGGTPNSIDAAASAGESFSQKVHSVSLVSLDDHDGNPDTARILICEDGRCVQEINPPNNYDQQQIARAVFVALAEAYKSDIQPYLVDSPDAAGI